MAAPGLHITIATTPRSEQSVAAEVALTKAALLYADDVTVCSANVAMLDAIGTILKEPPAVRGRQIAQVASVLVDDPKIRGLMEWMLAQPRKVRRMHPMFAEFDRVMAGSAAEAEEIIREMRRDASMDELQVGIDAGVVTVDTLGLDPITLLQDSILLASGRQGSRLGNRETVETLFDRISSIAAVGAGTYPLFDEGAGDLLETMIREGLVRGATVRPAGQAGLAAHFVAYLPAFPDARTREILDVRRGLEKPLIRFRGAMAGMASTLESAAWEPGFRQEADDLYRAEVAPALLDLEENAREQGAFELTLHGAGSKATWGTGGVVLGLGLTAAGIIPDVAAVAMSVGAPTATLVAGAVEAVRTSSATTGCRPKPVPLPVPSGSSVGSGPRTIGSPVAPARLTGGPGSMAGRGAGRARGA